MKRLLVFVFLIPIIGFSQNKKELNAIIQRLKNDSVNFELLIGKKNNEIKENIKKIDEGNNRIDELYNNSLKIEKINESYKNEINALNIKVESQKNSIDSLINNVQLLKDSFTNKLSELNFLLVELERGESPATSIEYMGNYLIILKTENTVIDVFKAYGQAESEFGSVFIRTSFPSQELYSIEEININKVLVSNFIFIDGEERTVWIKKYERNNNNFWHNTSCEGDCN